MEAEEDRWVDLRCDLWLAILTMAMLTGGLARAAILRFVTANANANSSRERRGVAMEAGGSRRVERGDEAQTRLGRRGRAAVQRVRRHHPRAEPEQQPRVGKHLQLHHRMAGGELPDGQRLARAGGRRERPGLQASGRRAHVRHATVCHNTRNGAMPSCERCDCRRLSRLRCLRHGLRGQRLGLGVGGAHARLLRVFIQPLETGVKPRTCQPTIK